METFGRLSLLPGDLPGVIWVVAADSWWLLGYSQAVGPCRWSPDRGEEPNTMVGTWCARGACNTLQCQAPPHASLALWPHCISRRDTLGGHYAEHTGVYRRARAGGHSRTQTATQSEQGRASPPSSSSFHLSLLTHSSQRNGSGHWNKQQGSVIPVPPHSLCPKGNPSGQKTERFCTSQSTRVNAP